MTGTDAAILALIVAVLVLAVAVLSQGRLKHLILMLLGAAPKRSASRIVTGLPHADRDWGVVANVSADPAAPVTGHAKVVAATTPADEGEPEAIDEDSDRDDASDDDATDKAAKAEKADKRADADETEKADAASETDDADDADEREDEPVTAGAGRRGKSGKAPGASKD